MASFKEELSLVLISLTKQCHKMKHIENLRLLCNIMGAIFEPTETATRTNMAENGSCAVLFMMIRRRINAIVAESIVFLSSTNKTHRICAQGNETDINIARLKIMNKLL